MARLALLILGALFAVSMAAIPSNYRQIPGYGAYRVVTEKKSWEEARLDCENDGADLAIINSPAESAVLKKLLIETPGGGLIAHIGFEDRDGDGNFDTVLKTSLNDAGFNTWKNQPSKQGEAMCGGMWICGRLGEIRCDNRLGYLCETIN